MVKHLQLFHISIENTKLSTCPNHQSSCRHTKSSRLIFDFARHAISNHLPLSVFFISLLISQTAVYGQQKEQGKTKDASPKEKTERSDQSIGFKKQTSVKPEPHKTTNTSSNQANSVKSDTPIQQGKSPELYSAPASFDINAVSADVRQKLDENKKNSRPFLEGIAMALEFELMDANVSESDLIERIEKSRDAQTPIQIKKKDKNLYWIVTDTNSSITRIKEIVSSAGLTVNFISKSYR
jgi:hypothetical protein